MLNRFPPEILSNIVSRLLGYTLVDLIGTGDKLLLRKIRSSPVHLVYDGSFMNHIYKLTGSFFKNVKGTEYTFVSAGIFDPVPLTFPETLDRVEIHYTSPEQVKKLLSMIPSNVRELKMNGHFEFNSSFAAAIPRSITSFESHHDFHDAVVFSDFCKNLPDLESLSLSCKFLITKESLLSLPRSLVDLRIMFSAAIFGFESGLHHDLLQWLPEGLQKLRFLFGAPLNFLKLPPSVTTVEVQSGGHNYICVKAENFPPTVKNLIVRHADVDDVEKLADQLDTLTYLDPTRPLLSASIIRRFTKAKRGLIDE